MRTAKTDQTGRMHYFEELKKEDMIYETADSRGWG